MAITFNDTTVNVAKVYYRKASDGSITERTSYGKAKDYFPNDFAVGDRIMFGMTTISNKVNLNVSTAIAATSVSGVWEYVSVRSSSPTWTALDGVVDGTNGFTTTGANSVSFTIPADGAWRNYPSYFYSIGDYFFYISYRITAVDTPTEGGAQASANITANPYCINVSGYSTASPCTFKKIYDADVAGSWGLVTRNKCQYFIKCDLSFDNLLSKNEQITFDSGFGFNIGGNLYLGEQVSGDKVTNGSNIIFLSYAHSYANRAICNSSNSLIYNSQLKHVDDPDKGTTSSYGQGYWGTGAGKVSYDSFFQRQRNLALTYADSAYIGLKSACHIEGTASAIIAKHIFVHTSGIRATTTGVHWHECDFSLCTNWAINPYLYGATVRDYYSVDCNFGVISPNKWTYWNSPGAIDTLNSWFQCSALLKIVDTTGTPIPNADVIIYDKNKNILKTLTTNEDGFATEEKGTVTSATTSTLSDTSKSWTTNQYMFKEVFITSGAGVGQRRYISSNTGNTLTLLPTLATALSTDSKYIVLPYITFGLNQPLSVSTTAWSSYTDFTPHTIKVSKAGYVGTDIITSLKEKTNMTIELDKVKNLNFSKHNKIITQ
jgi:hypothetical protein